MKKIADLLGIKPISGLIRWMFLCKIFEQVEKKSSEHVDFVYGCGKQGTVMHKEVEKAIQCHREIEKGKKKLELQLLRLLSRFGYPGMFLLLTIESIFPPIPSEVVLTFGGFMTEHTSLTLTGMVIAVDGHGSDDAGAMLLYRGGTASFRLNVWSVFCTNDGFRKSDSKQKISKKH